MRRTPSATIEGTGPGLATAPVQALNLTRSYGRRTVVANVSFSVRPGVVTGFLGPNGAGKSTTMRLLLGLEQPDSGHALINGRPYAALSRPLTEVGALLEARSFHKGRSARSHLLALAQAQGLPASRVEEVLTQVGLGAAGRRRAGGFSLGMAQRLGVASALLGDPAIVILDEPINGLDPEGVLWIRTLVKRLAAEGRTVLLSSHLMNEMAVTADHLLVIGAGRLLADCSTGEFIQRHTDAALYAATPEVARPALLEQAFLRLTASSAEYQAS
ncbi:ATP-binding cassette domain-containing protein [Kitasatospora sp. NBC_01287]|uniref:ABC transporter ATP-binding protein n=1 Tax=Kitasatospora sp. NBC_01287 TaxID=2903573 RepID=UPI002250496F|nr:ATP-binding cassette domain-containing protein [Kitasatospora sp. NBC_01287]MCX4748114.1 ATP-binding cassette domain-containing protein [Kitasatospora sp. NBC_01287]